MTKDKVVYILGAGFSAPLGLPLIGNFMDMAWDMYREDPIANRHFEAVFQSVREMSFMKTFYNSDLLNIEEILSILEMADFTNGNPLRSEFVTFITDVINRYTPLIGQPNEFIVDSWPNKIFGHSENWARYGAFTASLFNMSLYKVRINDIFTPHNRPYFASPMPGNADYGVITLNYDLALETAIEYCYQRYASTPNNYQSFPTCSYGFLGPHDANLDESLFPGNGKVFLAKLHGCVRNGNIVPPTWSKGNNRNIAPTWNLAERILAEADHIRIIGYSLPVADAYIKYLLKSAGRRTEHIKNIDVICLDNDAGDVEHRYRDFITFRRFRFRNANAVSYLDECQRSKNIVQLAEPYSGTNQLNFNHLESVHSEFMSKSD